MQHGHAKDTNLPSTKTKPMAKLWKGKASSANSNAMVCNTTLMQTQMLGADTPAPLV